MRSAITDFVPGSPRSSLSICCEMSSMTATSGPFTLMPTGVWMPVLCIMTRARIGCTQAFT